MKMTVLKWIADSSIGLLGRTIELLFRCVLCFLPLGIYMILLQKRSKASKVSSLQAFTNDRSIWQHVFPGFVLVAIEPDEMENFFININNNFKSCAERNKYLIALIFMSLIVGIMVLMYVRGGV